MAEIQQWSSTNDGFYSGSIKDNWAAVDADGYKAAVQKVYDDMCSDPDASYVVIEGKHTDPPLRDHGLKYRYTGNVKIEQTGPEQWHTDHDHLGNFKNWQGTRHFKFTFDIAVTTR
jgi:hypothetical protein